MTKYYPYYISPNSVLDNQARGHMLTLGKLGFFSARNGMKKLGFLYNDCMANLVAIQRKAIRDAGVSDADVVPFDLGCPAAYSPPSAIAQAVLTFQQQGVTHVTINSTMNADFINFTKVAQQQGFKPRYVLGADAIAASTTGASGADANNLDGAVNITSQALGEPTTPGFRPSSATARCDALFTSKGEKPTYQQQVGFGGAACAYLGFLAALISHAPQMSRTALVDGMASLGTLTQSFPYGRIDYAAAGTGAGYGIAFWRVERFSAACACWRIADPTWHAATS